jgi:hypothetical protein
VLPLDGPGQFAEYTLSGIVPEGATQADVGFRVNAECHCAGASDFTLYEARYVEDGDAANRVPNADFTRGMEGWASWGTGEIDLERSDRGAGSMLSVAATPADTAGLNSARFAVTPGAAYTVTFAARVAPRSAGSGYFHVVFFSSAELAREAILLEPASFLVGTTTTDARGTFRFDVQGLPPYNVSIRAKYSGDDKYWPAYADVRQERLAQ